MNKIWVIVGLIVVGLVVLYLLTSGTIVSRYQIESGE